MDFQIFDLSTADVGMELSPLQFRDKKEDEFFTQRAGKITGSQFGELVVKTRDKKGYTLSTGKVAENLIWKTAWERLLLEGNISNGLGRMNFSSKEVEHGNDFEQEAIMKYMEATGIEVDYHQKFIEYDSYIGGTPDGYIGKDGIIEVKCPWNGGNHLKSLCDGEIYNEKYIYQIQGYLWMTGRNWCDFITYDPDLLEPLQLNVIRVQRDENIIAGISEVMEQVKDRIRQIMLHPKLHELQTKAR